MSAQLKNQVRALVLLFVFSANIMAGFACSIGLDLGYNRDHHTREMNLSHRAHADKCHGSASGENPIPKPTHDCCSGDVTKLMLLDKSVAHCDWNAAVPVFEKAEAFAMVAETAGQDLDIHKLTFRHLRRSCFLNDTELYIAVRSLQI